MVSMTSSDSVFDSNEGANTHAQESNVETPAADSVQLGESANQVPHEAAELEQKQEAGDEVTSELPDVAVVEESTARPPSSLSRREIDECNSVSQLPKVIVKKSINAAVKRLSLHKDDEVETSSSGGGGANEEQLEAVAAQEDQVIEPLQHEAEGECTKETQQEEVPHESRAMEAEAIKDTDEQAVSSESKNVQEDATIEVQEIEIVEPPANNTTTARSGEEEGTIQEEEHVSSSSTTDTAAAANKDYISGQDPTVVEATDSISGAAVDENRPEDETVTEQEATAASDGNVPENNKDDQVGAVGTTEPTQAEERNDSEEADDGNSKTTEEVDSGNESVTPSVAQ